MEFNPLSEENHQIKTVPIVVDYRAVPEITSSIGFEEQPKMEYAKYLAPKEIQVKKYRLKK